MDRIIERVGWRGGHEPLDWISIQSELGVTLPRDYVEYSSVFPNGRFRSFLRVNVPTRFGMPPAIKLGIEILRDAVEGRDTISGLRSFPYGLFPDEGGILPWGTIERDFMICWDTSDRDPDKWPIVVVDWMLDEYWNYEGDMTSFILDFLDESTGIDELSYPDAPVDFVKLR